MYVGCASNLSVYVNFKDELRQEIHSKLNETCLNFIIKSTPSAINSQSHKLSVSASKLIPQSKHTNSRYKFRKMFKYNTSAINYLIYNFAPSYFSCLYDWKIKFAIYEISTPHRHIQNLLTKSATTINFVESQLKSVRMRRMVSRFAVYRMVDTARLSLTIASQWQE